ncbi:MAG: very short patch repair endonuclease [Actinomycetota bacterium]|nr:very short patch repair endonuclease [Actinomycetota bacterium]
MTRSQIMAQIRGKDTAPEIRLRKALWASGLRYRVHPKLPGRPDIAFPRAKVAVFVDGCFWHSCPLHGKRPKSNTDYWQPKLERNRVRDCRVDRALADIGWISIRVWEHEVVGEVDSSVARIRESLRQRLGRKDSPETG